MAQLRSHFFPWYGSNNGIIILKFRTSETSGFFCLFSFFFFFFSFLIILLLFYCFFCLFFCFFVVVFLSVFFFFFFCFWFFFFCFFFFGGGIWVFFASSILPNGPATRSRVKPLSHCHEFGYDMRPYKASYNSAHIALLSASCSSNLSSSTDATRLDWLQSFLFLLVRPLTVYM